jgi:hypothetical protein
VLLLVADGIRLSSKRRAAFPLLPYGRAHPLAQRVNRHQVLKMLGRLLSSPFQNAPCAHTTNMPRLQLPANQFCNNHSMGPTNSPIVGAGPLTTELSGCLRVRNVKHSLASDHVPRDIGA